MEINITYFVFIYFFFEFSIRLIQKLQKIYYLKKKIIRLCVVGVLNLAKV
ncbi:Uncharacterised protein [Candidatus Ornithobacterium hominis]|uniref:Uncharacterized protein n=1 Tax=Candidatus Ornithobacterium hominis TaxID=2497989 RepID=A0A383TVK2_9FLAO|nr:Uncharacterised protein [Candidatus Ornithobacterium hominis]